MIALAALSLRSPWNTGWRTRPSGVHSAKLTSATSFGLTQCSAPAARFDQRPGLTVPGANGERATSIFARRLRRAAPVAAFQPVPTLPAYCSLPSGSW